MSPRSRFVVACLAAAALGGCFRSIAPLPSFVAQKPPPELPPVDETPPAPEPPPVVAEPAGPTPAEIISQRDAGTRVPGLLASLSLEQKVGQLMMVGFGGLEVDEKIDALVRGRQVGGVCMFKRNITSAAQVARLNDQVRALLDGGVPPFIAVDQEGGNVVRVADGVTVLPGAMALGATRDTELAFQASRAQAEDLKRLGFNMNLAPVLDVNVNPQNPVIGIRSVGDRVELVSEVGRALVRGQQAANVATIAKHFPGHGNVDADSHKALPVLPDTEGQLLEQLQPFQAAMADGLDGVMTAHLAVPKVAGDDTPATLSAAILTGILRKRFGFDGLVLTDELEMQAIADRYGVGRAAVMAINAGADMVLIPWRVEKKTEVHQALLDAARSGAISQARLDEAVRHVLALKEKRGLFEEPPPLEARLASLGQGKAVGLEVARKAVTLLRADGVFPIKAPKKLVVVTAEASLGEAVLKRAPEARVLVVPAYPPDRQRNGLKAKAIEAVKGADLVVVGVVNARQVELAVNASLQGVPVVAVVMGLPYLASQLPQAKAVVLTYSYRDTAAEAAAAALFGEQGTPGRLPVALPRMPFGSGLDSLAGPKVPGRR